MGKWSPGCPILPGLNQVGSPGMHEAAQALIAACNSITATNVYLQALVEEEPPAAEQSPINFQPYYRKNP